MIYESRVSKGDSVISRDVYTAVQGLEKFDFRYKGRYAATTCDDTWGW